MVARRYFDDFSEGETLELGVSVFVRCRKVIEYAFTSDEMRRDLSKPNSGLDGLDLTKNGRVSLNL